MRFMLFDRWGNPLRDVRDPISAVRMREVSGEDSLELTACDPLEKDQRIVFQDSMGRWCEQIVAGADAMRSDRLVTVASCNSSIIELSRSYIEDARCRAYSPAAALAKALSGTRWSVGAVDAADAQDVSFYQCSVLEAIDAISTAYGLEVEASVQVDGSRVTKRSVSLVARRGADNGKRFTYSKDLIEVRKVESSADVVTRLYGYGKGLAATDEDGEETGGYTRKLTFGDVNGGLDYVEDSTALANWGMLGADGNKVHAVGKVEFSDCEDMDELLALTKAELAARSTPTVSYEASAIVLGKAGMSVEGVDVGDTVQIIDTSYPEALRLEGRVLKLEEDLLGGTDSISVTLGNIVRGTSQQVKAAESALSKLQSSLGAYDSAAKCTSSYIEQVIAGLNSVMNAAGGYVYMEPGEGITVYDRPVDGNPTMAIQLTGAGFRIASSKKSDGTFDWRTFGTGAGFTADELNAGVIRGGSSYWNLETGDLLFKQGRIADAAGKTSWNLTTGAFQGTDISASGTFTTTSGQREMSLGDGKLRLLDSGAEVASIELSDLVLSLMSTNKISIISDYVLQLMSGAGLYITAPYVVATDPSTGTSCTAYTGTTTLGSKSVKVVNGLITSIS